MSEKRRQYDRHFKLSAVRLLESSDKPLVQVARELGISGSMLRRWLNDRSKPLWLVIITSSSNC